MMKTLSVVERLRHNILFEDITEEIFDKVYHKMKEQRYNANDVILEDESEGEELFLLVEGRVKILKRTKFGEEKLLALLHPGDFFGELELVDGRPRSAWVIAVDDCLAFTLHKDDFERLLKDSHGFSIRLMQVLSLRLRALNNHFIGELARNAERNINELKKLEQLIDATKIVNSTLNLDKLLDLILEAALIIVNGDRGTVYLIDETKQELWSKIYRGTEHIKIHLPVGRGIAGYVAATGDTINIKDAYLDPRFNPKIDKKTGYKTKTILCMPLKNKEERIIGVLQLLNKRNSHFTHDDENFIRALSIHAAIAIENARLYEAEKAYHQMQEDIRLAAKIQMELLPQSSPQLPGYEIAGKSIPAKLVGGDYFDFIPIDDHHVGLCLGDVSGKGLPASLLMANLQATLRGQSFGEFSPKQCLARSNSLLFRSTSSDKFVTLIYCVLDTIHHQLKYSNAGHDHPFLLTANDGMKRLSVGGIILGVMDKFTFEEEAVQLHPGDVLLFYSDGIVEAMNGKGRMFGEERLSSILIDNTNKSAEEIVETVIDSVKKFAGNTPQTDDITLMVVKRKA